MSTDVSIETTQDLEALFREDVPCKYEGCTAVATWGMRWIPTGCSCRYQCTLCEPHVKYALRLFASYPLWRCECGIIAPQGTMHTWPL